MSICAYNFEHNSWPKIEPKNTPEIIADYAVIETAPYAENFTIQSDPSLWKIVFAMDQGKCSYTMSASKTNYNSNYNTLLTVKDQVTEDLINKVEKNKTQELGEYVEKMSNRSIPYFLPEQQETGESINEQTAGFLAILLQGTLKAGICILLGASSCTKSQKCKGVSGCFFRGEVVTTAETAM